MSGTPPGTAEASTPGDSLTATVPGRLAAWRGVPWPLALGTAAFAVSIAVYVVGWAAGWTALTPNTTDLQVYVDGGLIVRHVAPAYDGTLASPLYDWQSLIGLDFTYTPFAAVIFAAVSFIPWSMLAQLAAAVNVAALAGSLWLVLGPLGYRGKTRAGVALLASAAALWLEPVQRTLFLGQVNLVLMLLVLADLCVPDSVAGRWWKGTWWKGTGIGIAAGIKLVPLVFIPYLLLTRKFREAAVAAGVFAATIAVGFAVIPRDSSAWWLHGLFYQSGRVGFPGVTQNQSLHGLITRLAGSVAAGQPVWLAVAVVVGVTGIACAALLDRAGQPVLGIVTCALTGLLISPVSWDHHWVWIAPGLVVMGHLALRTWQAGRRRAATALCGLTAIVWAVFGARPEGVWLPGTAGIELTGLLWAVPTTRETAFFQLGDQRWFPEYHYHGFQFIGGNPFVLTGLVLFALLIAGAVKTSHRWHSTHDTALATAVTGASRHKSRHLEVSMRRLTRGRICAALLSAVAIAALTAGCSSSAAVTAPETPPPSLAHAAGYQDTQQMKTCLHSYGISRNVLREIFNGASAATTGLSEAKLKAAGEKCWTSSETGVAATAIRKIDNCLTQEGVNTASTGSALADVLLALDVHTAKAQNAVRFCLRT